MQPSFEMLVGMPVSHVWFGYGSALFLELGTLTENKRHDGTPGNPLGEVTVMADFVWRIESQRSIVCGSGEHERCCASISKKLLGASVVAAGTTGRIPELQIEFSNKLWLVTFDQFRSQPDWAVIFNTFALALCVKAGRISVEQQHS